MLLHSYRSSAGRAGGNRDRHRAPVGLDWVRAARAGGRGVALRGVSPVDPVAAAEYDDQLTSSSENAFWPAQPREGTTFL